MVHPAPTPDSITLLRRRRKSLGGRSQNDKLFIRGKAISTHPSIGGRSQLLNPPIRTGITKKKIMIRPWAVIRTLYVLSDREITLLLRNSLRIAKLITVPSNPDQAPKKK
jgi:hypothetical protein